jgi:hypothetical protein
MFSIMASVVLPYRAENLETQKSEESSLQTFVLFFSTIFIISYSFQIIVFGSDRPRLYSENNFEIPSLLLFLSAIFAINYNHVIPLKPKNKWIILLGTLSTFLSLSKSGVLEALTLALSRAKKINNIKQLTLFISVAVLISLLTVTVILSRLGGQNVEHNDRYIFLRHFISDFSKGDYLQWLLGNGVASKLPHQTCTTLSYFSEAIFETALYCNSLIYHSFLLRLVYDYGILSALIFLLIWYKLLRLTFKASLANIIFLIVMVASLSVSGFANSIIIWPIFTLTCFHFLRKQG